jgi:hypothetical protein
MTRDQIEFECIMKDMPLPDEAITELAEAGAATMHDGDMKISMEGLAIMLHHSPDLSKAGPLIRGLAVALSETKDMVMARKVRAMLKSRGIVLPKV